LSITCDNASVNDVMIVELADLISEFPGEANQMRCFSHVLSLVAKSVIKMFDAPKTQESGKDASLNDSEALLMRLAEGIDLEERETRASLDNDEDLDDQDGWVDEVELLSEEEQAEFESSILPVRLVIVKVRHGLVDCQGWELMTTSRTTSCTSLHSRLSTPRLYSYRHGRKYLPISSFRCA
jgi:hypothetical protein